MEDSKDPVVYQFKVTLLHVGERFNPGAGAIEVLNDDLREIFCRWFSGMKSEEQSTLKTAA
ncbi:MAG: hypothetical protein ABSA46_16440 [Thermodesulfovibrionales bacterium]|jgi:hypothetical protein